jgi:hypothetical protein
MIKQMEEINLNYFIEGITLKNSFSGETKLSVKGIEFLKNEIMNLLWEATNISEKEYFENKIK